MAAARFLPVSYTHLDVYKRQTQAIIDRMRDEMPRGKPVALAINKIDRVKAEVLLALAQKMNEAFPFAETFMISAEKGYGVCLLYTSRCV